MSEPQVLPVNHHADHPGFSGLTGALFGLAFLLIGGANARLAVEAAGVTATDRVVDIGCGPGNAVRAAAARGAHAIGVDPSSTLLAIAKAVTRRPNVEWVPGTAERVPVADGSASVVWALATVHHWQDVGAAVREAFRVLAPNGRLLAIERRTEPGATGAASHGWTAQQAEAFAALCRDAGFTEVEIGQRSRGRRTVWVVRATRP